MSMQRKMKTRGILMLVCFFAVLAVIFSPVFPGNVNGLDYMDNLFNMISKGSSNFISSTMKESDLYRGNIIELKVKMSSEQQAEQVAVQLVKAGAEATAEGAEVAVRGGIGVITAASLVDAEMMFANKEEPILGKYGFSGREALNNWWTLFKSFGPALNKQEKFKEAKFFAQVQKKALEPSYNYFGVEAMHWKDNITLILLALAFYVVYTIWYGFGIMFLFEGLGLKISH